MKKIIFSLTIASGLFLYSCEDPSKDAAKKAAEEQNQNTTSGSTQTQEEGIKKDSIHADDGKINGSRSKSKKSTPK